MRRLWALEKDNMISPIVYMYNAIFFPFLSFLAMLRDLWDLSFPTRDQTWALAVKAQSPNHWTARELPMLFVT